MNSIALAISATSAALVAALIFYGMRRMRELQAKLIRTQQTEGVAREAAEHRLRETEARLLSETRYHVLFDDMPVALVEATPDNRILTANRAWRRLYGFADDVDLDTIQASSLYGDLDVRSQLRPGGEPVRVNTTFWRDGQQVQAEGYFRLLADAHGEPQTIIGALVDITEKHKLEDKLREAQKMEAVGQLTGGIAHDFNNLLTVVLGSAELLHDGLEAQPQLLPLTEGVMEAGRRGAELTQNLLAFSQRQALRPEVTDVNDLMTRMEDLIRRTVEGRIEIALVRGEGVADITVDRAQLETALLNLASNARDAMPAGGSLTLETANVELDEDYVRQGDGVEPGPYTMIAVSDTGHGMMPEVMSRAFDPFFTTKEVGKGTGLGLSMVHGLIKQSHGHVELSSELNRGTTVRLYLPRTRAADRPPAAATEIEEERRGDGEVILVVEDDELVRSYVERQLARMNYRVISAVNGRAALDLLRQGQKIDLLFTDVVMPEMTGPELVAEARRFMPNLKVLYTSGFTEAASKGKLLMGPDDELLSKPYQRRALAAKLRLLLDRKG